MTDKLKTPFLGDEAQKRVKSLRKRFFVALPFGVAVMFLSMLPSWQFLGWQWVVGALALPVVTWGAWPFHVAAFKAARHGSTTMDTLVSLGVVASSAWSYWALFWGGAGHVGTKMDMSFIPRFSTYTTPAQLYFEAATMIVVFLLGGRWAEARTRHVAGTALRELLNLGAQEATLIVTSTDNPNVEKRVPASVLTVGDLFLVRPGEKVATDGVVIQGSSALDTSLLTGESVPTDVEVDDIVTGGTINTWGSLLVKATRVGEDTTLSQISRMVVEAQATKAPVQRLADRVSSVFVPTIIAISLVTLFVWITLGNPLSTCFAVAASTLVVACPCALGLATPTALLVGSGRAWQLGILIRNAEVLEQTRAVDTAVLDKTGTVTTGVLQVEKIVSISGDSDDVLRKAANVESHSEHPFACAIVRNAKKRGLVLDETVGFQNHAGKGVSAFLTSNESTDHKEPTPLSSNENMLLLVGGSRWLTNCGVNIPLKLLESQKHYEKTGASVVTVAQAPISSMEHALPMQPQSTPKEKENVVFTVESKTVTLAVFGMSCASCVNRVERKLEKLPSVTAKVNLATQTATVTAPKNCEASQLKETIEAAGFDAQILHEQNFPQPQITLNQKVIHQSLQHQLGTTRVEVLGLIVLRDTIKPNAKKAISQFKQMGITPILLSGDNTPSACHVAELVGIETVIAEVLPEQKRQKVQHLQQTGNTVAMIGDGVNDVAAMAEASKKGLAIAMGSGTDVAIATADITLVNSDLESATTAIHISQKTLKIIKGNLFWAFFYNTLAIPLATIGLLNPMIAAAAMASSSLLVVLNSLRLRST